MNIIQIPNQGVQLINEMNLHQCVMYHKRIFLIYVVHVIAYINYQSSPTPGQYQSYALQCFLLKNNKQKKLLSVPEFASFSPSFHESISLCRCPPALPLSIIIHSHRTLLSTPPHISLLSITISYVENDEGQQPCAPPGCVRDHGQRHGHLFWQDWHPHHQPHDRGAKFPRWVKSNNS